MKATTIKINDRFSDDTTKLIYVLMDKDATGVYLRRESQLNALPFKMDYTNFYEQFTEVKGGA